MSEIPMLEELQALLDELREGEISESRQSRLAGILRDSDEARAYYLDYMRLVGTLHRFHVEPAGEAEPAIDDPPVIAGSIAAARSRASGAGRMFRWAAAALVMIAAGVAFFLVHRSREPVAILAGAVDAKWENVDHPAGSQLKRGNLHLISGGVRIAFNAGADVIVYGPARFDVKSPNSLRLTEGRICARIQHGSPGFAVETPSATLTDLGTEFVVEVDAAGVTQTQVVAGQIRVKPTNAAETILKADMALSVSGDGTTTSPIPFRRTEFTHSLLRIDLVDIVAGGDGTQMHRDSGIDATTGKLYDTQPQSLSFNGDEAFHPVPGRPLIAGVFVPGGRESILDPDGHRYGFVTADRKCSYLLWAGPLNFSHDPSDRPAQPNLIGSVDYGILPHGILFMHANKAITFDLNKIAAAHSGLTIRAFHAVCQNTGIQCTSPKFTEKAEVSVFADGKLIDQHALNRRTDSPVDLAAAIPENARYLTIAVTDAGDGSAGDWVTLGDPQLR